MDFDTANGAIDSIDNAIKKIEEAKKYLNSNTLIVNDNFDALKPILDEVVNIAYDMLYIRNKLLQSSLTMKNCYDTFNNINK